ncbi:Predicted arabinose efflux permease, MFS family [Lachnospiraceae bacterium KHCPX20]|jgi:MFS family permease|nr:Predicted arabinose efflux permease, MFS family [Lachnospiraceae bacterium KHCPX20]
MSDIKKKVPDLLCLALFLLIFINGFESGGYQASLHTIGKAYDLSITSMGLFATVELFSTMLAPIILGGWADHIGKKKSLILMIYLQIISCAFIGIGSSQIAFLLGIFILGISTSTIQFVGIAAVGDIYKDSGFKIGIITSMYALGSVVAPLVVGVYLKLGVNWRVLFWLIMIISAFSLIGLFDRRADWSIKKEVVHELTPKGELVIPVIMMLSFIMLIYVGFENGFAFFVNSYFLDELHSEAGEFALSLYWMMMIPSRLISGKFSQHAVRNLILATVSIPLITVIMAYTSFVTVELVLGAMLGFACGAIYPNVLTLAMKYSGRYSATATGIITTATGIGGVIFTGLMGIMADNLGYRTALILLALMFMVDIIIAVGLKLYCRHNRVNGSERISE